MNSNLCFRSKNPIMLGMICFAFSAKASTPSWTLDHYLELVVANNSDLEAARLQKKAAQLRQNQGDLLELSPKLQLQGGYTNDEQVTAFPTQQGQQTLAKYYSLGVAKGLSTGTQLSLAWSQTFSDVRGTAFLRPSWESRYSFNVTQSLWKNFIGHATRMRHQREEAQAQAAVLAAEMQLQQNLIQAETSFWNYALNQLDRLEKEDALNRAKKIRDWTARRLRDGIGDRADLLQVESLLAARELEQINSRDAYEASRKQFFESLGDTKLESITISSQEIMKPRAMKVNLKDSQEIPKRMDVWIQTYAAKAAELSSLEFEDSLKPDLKLLGTFGANGRNTELGTSAQDAISSDRNMYNVGLSLALNLDFALMNNLREAARAEAKASSLKSRKLDQDALVSWEELMRKHSELSLRIAAMEKLAKAQESQLKREQERLEVGRTTTFQVISFEQDVATTRLNLLELRGHQRKLEAASRLYVTQSEVESL